MIVEGHTEFYSFPKLSHRGMIKECPPLRIVNLRGIGGTVAAEGISKMVAPKVLSHIEGGRTKIIVCLDREKRDESPGCFAEAIRNRLVEFVSKKARVSFELHVIVLNRSFEAILLADAQGLYERKHFKKRPQFHRFEGELGKGDQLGIIELTELLAGEYHKTQDGPRLFEKIDVNAARRCGPQDRGSKSFDKLLRVLEKKK